MRYLQLSMSFWSFSSLSDGSVMMRSARGQIISYIFRTTQPQFISISRRVVDSMRLHNFRANCMGYPT